MKFNLYDFKTLIVNAVDKREALKTLWAEWDSNAMSLWYIHYQKYEGEGIKLPTTNNHLNGFIQRIDDKLRKHAIGVLGVYGDEPSLEVMGVFLWRGTEIIFPLADHPQFEYFTKRSLDVTKEEDRKLFEDFWAANEDDVLLGLKCQTKKLYK